MPEFPASIEFKQSDIPAILRAVSKERDYCLAQHNEMIALQCALSESNYWLNEYHKYSELYNRLNPFKQHEGGNK